MPLPSVAPINEYVIQCSLDPNSTTAIRLPVPRTGRVRRVIACRTGALSTGATLTLTSAKGALTQTVAIASGGAAGDIDSQEFTPGPAGQDYNNNVAEGEQVRIASGGGPTAGQTLQIAIVIRP